MMQDTTLARLEQAPAMTTTHWLTFLVAAVVILVGIVAWDRKKNPDMSLAQIIRTWPHTDTLLMSGVLLSAWTVVFYEGCLVAFKTTSYEPFTASMEPVFTFLNWMVLTGAGAAIGRRMTTKAEVIEAHGRIGATGEMPAQREP